MKLFHIILLFFFISCGSAKTGIQDDLKDTVKAEKPKETYVTEESKAHNIIINISHFIPYCGGAAPPDDIIDRQTQVQSNTNFILIDQSSGTKETVQTDSTGTLYLNLSSGNYALREMYKDCSYEEFYKKNYLPTDQWHQPATDPNCYRNWWAKNLLEMNIAKTDSLYTFNLQTSESCFVGRNPCVIYVGPMPP